MLLLHGIPGCRASWGPVAARLGGHCTTVVPDLLGFGDSPRPRDLPAIHAVGQARTLADTLDHLDIRPDAVIGHDFGGPVALALAGSRPDLVPALGLVSANVFADTPVPFPLSLINAPIVGRLLAPLLFSRPSLRLMLRQGAGTKGLHIDAASAIGNRAQSTAIRTIFEGSLRNLDRLYSPLEASLRQLAVPAFVCWGDADPFFSVAQGKRTADALAGSSFHLLAGGGHFLPEERPDELAALILNLVNLAKAI